MGKVKTCFFCGYTYSRDVGMVCERCQKKASEAKRANEMGEGPAVDPELEASLLDGENGQVEEQQPTSKRILVVDDDPAIVKMLRRRFEHASYEVLAAHDGSDGLALMQEVKPDLVVLDILMDNMTGLEVIKKFKDSFEGDKKIPIILMSGRKDMANFIDAWAYEEFFQKPFDVKAMLAKIEDLIGKAG